MLAARFYTKFLAFGAVCAISKFVGELVILIAVVTFHPKETNCSQMTCTLNKFLEKVSICFVLPFAT